MVENQEICKDTRINLHCLSHCLSMSAVYSVAAIVTTVLNSLIVISIWKTPSLHKPSYILIGSLALSDLLVGAVGDPLMIFNNVALQKDWFLEITCVVFRCARGVGYALAAVSLLTLMFISLDRLLAVRLRNRYQSVVTRKRILLLLLIWWVIIFVIAGTVLSYQALTGMLFFAGTGVLVPVFVITITYSMAFYGLRKITSSVAPRVPTTDSIARPIPCNIDVAKYRKSLVTMFVVFILTMFFYMPYVCISIMLAISYDQVAKKNLDFLILGFMISEFVALLNSAVNPLVYLWRIRDIRQAVKTTVKRALKIS